MADIYSRSESSEPPKKKTKGNNFRWDESVHSDLIDCLREYKIRCEYNGIDFDTDKVAQYRAVRLAMEKKYEHDISLFGPVSVTPPPRQMQELNQQEKAVYDVQSKQENNLISRGHNRILEKAKSLRQGFSKAVLAGGRSGSGTLLYDHYDSLKGSWVVLQTQSHCLQVFIPTKSIKFTIWKMKLMKIMQRSPRIKHRLVIQLFLS